RRLVARQRVLDLLPRPARALPLQRGVVHERAARAADRDGREDGQACREAGRAAVEARDARADAGAGRSCTESSAGADRRATASAAASRDSDEHDGSRSERSEVLALRVERPREARADLAAGTAFLALDANRDIDRDVVVRLPD